MATTLSVSEMLPNKFEPKRKYRWIFQIEGIDAFLMKTAQRPTFQFEEMKSSPEVMEWVRTHFESVSGRGGYADFYKRDCQLKLLDPVGTVVELWDMKGCMIKNANFQDLDYTDGTTPMAIDLQLRIDNCVLQF